MGIKEPFLLLFGDGTYTEVMIDTDAETIEMYCCDRVVDVLRYSHSHNRFERYRGQSRLKGNRWELVSPRAMLDARAEADAK